MSVVIRQSMRLHCQELTEIHSCSRYTAGSRNECLFDLKLVGVYILILTTLNH